MLFNLVMMGLAHRLDTLRDLRFTIYTDDITLWSTTSTITHQQWTIQHALNTIDAFLADTGMSPSPEKTQYLIMYGCSSDEACLQLHFGDKPLHSFHFDQDTWHSHRYQGIG